MSLTCSEIAVKWPKFALKNNAVTSGKYSNVPE